MKQACSSVFNGACGIRCNGGYKLVGSSIRLCQENGTWSGEEAQCQMRNCGHIPALQNGRQSSVDYTSRGAVIGAEENVYGSVVEFACDPGYELAGPDRVTCEKNEKWSGPFPSCRPVQCAKLGLVAQTNVSLKRADPQLDAYHYGDELSYSCRKGYTFKTDSQVRPSATAWRMEVGRLNRPFVT